MSDWKFVTSVLVERPPGIASSLWLLARSAATQLVVVVSAHPGVASPLDWLLAYGVDPDDKQTNTPVFEMKVQRAYLGGFLKSLFDGDIGEAGNAIGNAVVIKGPDPTPPGPKANQVILYAKTLPTAEETLALGAGGS